MEHIAGRKSALTWAVHISAALLVILWSLPTLGLLVSSFRTADQIATSGWWDALFPQEQTLTLRTADAQAQRQIDGQYVIEGQLFEPGQTMTISAWGTSSNDIGANKPGDSVSLRDGGTLSVGADGAYRMTSDTAFTGARGQRVFVTANVPPSFSFENYRGILFEEGNVDGIAKAFYNTLTVTIPATIIPILVAAFAAYALAWMEFPGRSLIIAAVVALLVVPLQLALIPLLRLHNEIGIGKGYIGAWLAHTGFGMPMAIYLLRNYMAGLPRDIIENARVDGATEFEIFAKIILPLSYPALASFAIFQFLWTWNDLLVAMVFLIDSSGDTTVMTKHIVELLGTRGGNWEILASSAFVSIAIPLAVFFSMQRYLVRGMLAGSVK
ncbi:carbohydrate ABC transporter permease [Pleomorphomonas sp. JP5]|uniref:carbohydrate ABC transporter permease n=1 Tax=Pleomorphomonas sp. JP5 TaxID=2942998 RepID=UPI00204318F9|nr:carbohydrate ABC transporter permease [Pleomorphomonas sp. JP5]MCM5557466.1 carbohydrate ABC transporter permease [Pleomorphomonas sp. JP5]